MKSKRSDDLLENLLHDVKSNCSSLNDAAALLQKSPQTERDELLEVMAQQAQTLVKAIIDYKATASSHDLRPN